MAAEPTVRFHASVVPVDMLPGIQRRTLVSGDKEMLCEFSLAKDAVVPLHQHHHEQVGYVVRGRVEFTIAGVAQVVGPGDGYLIPGNLQHGARALEESVIVEVFAPPREDYA